MSSLVQGDPVGFLQINVWMLGSVANAGICYLCCKEYKDNPSKKSAAFIFHTFLRGNLKKTTSAMEYCVPSVDKSYLNEVRKCQMYFKMFILKTDYSWWERDLPFWLKNIKSIDSKPGDFLFAGLAHTIKKIIFTMPIDVKTMKSVAAQTAKDMKLGKGGRTQHKEGEIKGYFSKVAKYKKLANDMAAMGLPKIAKALNAAL